MNVKVPFEAVVAGHGATVLRVCRAMLDASDADDAWSETFLSAFKAYPDLPPDANVEAWLVTIAHRKAIDVTRATSRRATPVEDIPDSAPDVEADVNATTTWLTHCRGYPPNKSRSSPTTISPACPTRRSA